MHGEGRLAEHAADYVIRYADGSEARAAIRRRRQIGAYHRRWGENCFEAVAHHKPHPRRAGHEQVAASWGWSQTRVVPADDGPWVSWLWAWENPHPEKVIAGFRFEPVAGAVVILAISAGDVAEFPLRWQPRRKARLVLPEGESLPAGPGRGRAARTNPARSWAGDLRHPAAGLPERCLAGGLQQPVAGTCRPRDPGRVHRAPGSLLPPLRPRRQPGGPGLRGRRRRFRRHGARRRHPSGRACRADGHAARGRARRGPAGAGQAAHPRRSRRIPGAGRPPPHPQPRLVRGLQRRLPPHPERG